METVLVLQPTVCHRYKVASYKQFDHSTIYGLIQSLAKGAAFVDCERDSQTFSSIFRQQLSTWVPGQCIEVVAGDKSAMRRCRVYDDPPSGVVIEISNDKDQITCSDTVAGANLLTCWDNLTGNDSQAQFLLGMKCLRRLGWDSVDDAYKLFSLAASQDHVLAKCYQTLVDMKRCARHFGDSSELSRWITFDPYEVASWLPPDRRHGSYLDIKTCYDNIVCLQHNGCVPAKYIHAWILINKSDRELDRRVARDIVERILKECAEKDYAPAQYQLAQLLRKSGDEGAAQPWLERAANHDYAPAQYQLSVLLRTRSGCQAAANRYLEAAFKQGYTPAINDINIIEGNNVFMNYAVAERCTDNQIMNMPALPMEIAAEITSYNTVGLMEASAANSTWLDEMLELIRWDASILV